MREEQISDEEQHPIEGPTIRLGISTCLLGERVRFDGGHKLDRYLTGTIGFFVEWVPVCPEVEMGLPIPRESLRLVGERENPRLIAPRSGTDHTEAMIAWARKRVAELASAGLHGFVFKKDWLQPLARFYLSGAYSSPSIIHQALRAAWALALGPNREYHV